MTSLNLKDIVRHMEDVQTLIESGQRVLPFLRESAAFLRDIEPLLTEVDQSIQESNAKMPRAASRLKDVSQATEVATTEIMDLVDEAIEILDQNTKHSRNLTDHVAALRTQDEQLLALLRDNLPAGDLLNQVEALHQEAAGRYDQIHTANTDELASQDAARDKLNRIFLSLQVQDITSQQLAAVKHLIESVRNRMEHLNGRLDLIEPAQAAVGDDIPQDATFDINAEFDRSGKRQDAADAVIQAMHDGAPLPEDVPSYEALQQETPAAPEPVPTDAGETASADDIDALFASGAAHEEASADDIDALFASGSAGEEASADDIDALFAEGGAAQEEATADDIDALFSGGGAPPDPAPTRPNEADAPPKPRAGATDGSGTPAQHNSGFFRNMEAGINDASVSQDDINKLFGA